MRYLRSIAAAGISLVLAVSGHRAGGGEIAPGSVIAAVFALVFVAAWLLGTRQLTAGQIVGLLLIAQIGVHLSCVFSGATVPFGPVMICGHLVATAFTALFLVRGERFLWTVADRLGLRALRLFFAGVVAVGPAIRLRFSRQDVFLPSRLVLVGGNGLRGPPVGRT